MLRSDRNLVERFFSQGVVRVLCCTATLAWGVNLPAHAVVVRGTELYDAQKGAFVDLGILDVLQASTCLCHAVLYGTLFDAVTCPCVADADVSDLRPSRTAAV